MSTTLGAHISWTGLPGDSAVQWSDISQDITAIDTQRGRSTELDQVQTGTASIQLDNWNGAYTPGRPYGPELLPKAVSATTDATQWTKLAGTTLTTQTSLPTPSGYTGSNSSLLLTVPSAASGAQLLTTPRVPVTVGTPYRASFRYRNPGSIAKLLSARIAFYDSSGVEITTGVDHDFAYRQYADVVAMSLPATYHRLGAYETLTNQSNALAGVDPMVCYNVATTAGSWSKYNGSGPAAGTFNGTSSVAEPAGLHIAYQANLSSTVEFWFKTSTAGPILGDYNMAGSANPITAAGVVDLTSGKLWPGLYVGTDGFLYCQASRLSGEQIVSPYQVNDGVWHHFVAAGIAYSVNYYLDGVQIGTETTAAVGYSRPILGCADTTHNTTYHSGASTPALTALPATNWFTGQITDFAQYRQGLSAADVADHYRHGSTSTFNAPPAGTGVLANRWFPLSASGVAPTGAVTAALIVQTDQALTSVSLNLYGASLKAVNTNYGKILPRRKIRVFSTTGQNLMPPGLNVGYDTYDGVPAGMDVNEVGAWVLPAGTNFFAQSGVMQWGPVGTSSPSWNLLGPSGNGPAIPWMLVPGNTYTFTAQVAAAQFSTNSTGLTISLNSTVTASPGSATSFSGSATTGVIAPGNLGWKTVTLTLAIPSTYLQPELQFTCTVSETLSSGTTYTYSAFIKNLQLVDVTKGQAVPAYTAGDGTLPVFQGFVDKWESLTKYDDTAAVVATCSDAMRVMGDTQLPRAPQALGFQPDWRVLGSWELNGSGNINSVDPNNQIPGASTSGTNSTVSNMTYSPGLAQSYLPGEFLGGGNTGAVWGYSPALYLMSFGKLAAGMSTEFWFIPRQSGGATGTYGAGDQYVAAMAPYFSVYASVANGGAGGFNRAWCGWGDWNAFSAVLTPGASNDVMLGGHIAIECVTSGGASPTVTVTVYFNGAVLVQGTAEPLTMPASNQFQLSGNTNLAPAGRTALPPFTFELYAPASYAGTGLDWAGRLAALKSGRASGTWSTSAVVNGPPAQTVMPRIMGACGLARPSAQLVTGSPSTSTASLVDPPSFTSASGLDALNTVAAQIGGLVCMSRYSAVMIQDSAYRTDTIPPYVFSALGATAPDASLLFLSDIDRTWTEVDISLGDPTWAPATNYPAYLRYGSHRQSMNMRDAELNEYGRAAVFLASYMIPSTRCDSASFTVINQALAAQVPLVDVGSRVVFTDLPANAPVENYFAWVESVAVSAKADGGTLVPTVTFSLSPDFTHLPIQ